MTWRVWCGPQFDSTPSSQRPIRVDGTDHPVAERITPLTIPALVERLRELGIEPTGEIRVQRMPNPKKANEKKVRAWLASL